MSFNNKLHLDTNALAKLQHLTAIYDSLETALSLHADCREKLLAIANLEQSHMWIVKTIEREQLEHNFRSGHSMPQQQEEKSEPKLSPEATVLAESRFKLDSLMSSIKDLTNTVAVKGFQINKG